MSARKASKYAQVSASVRAMKSKMLAGSGYERLLRCSNSTECVSILREEGYFETQPTGEESIDQTYFQHLLDQRTISVVKKLARLSPRDCTHLLAEFENQYRFELLKSGLRLILAHEASEVPYEASTDLLRGIAETRNLELLVQSAGASRLYGDISAALAENKPLPIVEAMIDRHALITLWNAADMVDSIDRGSVRPLIGERIDMINLLLVVRSKTLKITEEETRRVLVPVNYRLGETLTEAASSGSSVNALRAFSKTAYSSALSEFLEGYNEGGPLHALDVSLRKRHAKSCLWTFSGFPFCAGFPLAFGYLMTYEAADLRSIISGKADGLPAANIEQFLIL